MATPINHSPEYTTQYGECKRMLERLPQMLIDHPEEIAAKENTSHIDDLKQVAKHLVTPWPNWATWRPSSGTDRISPHAAGEFARRVE
jgi:hypothetical protein